MCGIWLAEAMICRSLQPVKVIKLARLYGMQWHDRLAECAACDCKYELLKWLHNFGCPWNIYQTVEDALYGNDLEHVKRLHAITGPWSQDLLADYMSFAGRYNDEVDAVEWLREQEAPWPECFYDMGNTPHGHCWSLRCVQWAIANGSSRGTWRCQDLAPEHYHCGSNSAGHNDDTCTDRPCYRKQACMLFFWAHENGCPCTCGNA
jgi:hypothetical protein